MLILDNLDESSLPAVIFDLRTLITTSPHTGSWFDIVGSTGVAVLMIALCLLIADALPRVFYPVAAVGSMALTSYTIQVVAISLRGDPELAAPTNTFFLQLTGAVLGLATIWRMTLGTGPLERAMTSVSKAAARLTPPTPRAPASTEGTAPNGNEPRTTLV